MLYSQCFQSQWYTVIKHLLLFVYQLLSWGRPAGCWAILFMALVFLNPADSPGHVFLMAVAGAQKGKLYFYKHILSLYHMSLICQHPIGQHKSHDQVPLTSPSGREVGNFRKVKTNVLFWERKAVICGSN